MHVFFLKKKMNNNSELSIQGFVNTIEIASISKKDDCDGFVVVLDIKNAEHVES